MTVWPFAPTGEFIEALEWRTDVLRAVAGEQRIQLRATPRRTWQFRHVFDAGQAAAALALVRATETFVVPDWARKLWTGNVAAGTSVSLALDTTDLALSAGDTVVLWQSPNAWEVTEIESVAADALVLATVTQSATVILYPGDAALAPEGLTLDRPAGRHVRGEIQFVSVNGAPDEAASVGYATYRGHDVLPIVPVVGAGSLAEGLAWPVEVFDTETGPLSATRRRNLPDARHTMRWHAFTPADIRETRQWIASRHGRWKAFWRSTWRADLMAAAGIGASDAGLRVYLPTGAPSLGETDFDLEINGLALYRRRVTAVEAAADLDGRPTVTLTLDSALGVTHTLAQIGRISFLRCQRFDADRIEIAHAPGAGQAISVPCIEVPVP